MEIITLIIGLAIGLIIAGLFLKKRISDAENVVQSKGQVELALSNERLSAATEEAKRLNGELTESEQQREIQRQQLGPRAGRDPERDGPRAGRSYLFFYWHFY